MVADGEFPSRSVRLFRPRRFRIKRKSFRTLSYRALIQRLDLGEWFSHALVTKHIVRSRWRESVNGGS
jgi:hypothetical protein